MKCPACDGSGAHCGLCNSIGIVTRDVGERHLLITQKDTPMPDASIESLEKLVEAQWQLIEQYKNANKLLVDNNSMLTQLVTRYNAPMQIHTSLGSGAPT